MSVIAVKKYSDKIVIGADSIQVRGRSKKEEIKLFCDEEKHIAWGSSGDCGESTLFDIFLKTHNPAGNTKKEIYEFFLEFMKYKKEFNNDKIALENNYLFIFETSAYCIFSSGHIEEIKENEYEAIGAGFQEAKTALYLGHTIEEALKATCANNTVCMEPITIYKISNNGIKLYEGEKVIKGGK